MLKLKTIALMLALGTGLFAQGGSGGKGLMRENGGSHPVVNADGGNGTHGRVDGGGHGGGMVFLAGGGGAGTHGIYMKDLARSPLMAAGGGSSAGGRGVVADGGSNGGRGIAAEVAA